MSSVRVNQTKEYFHTKKCFKILFDNQFPIHQWLWTVWEIFPQASYIWGYSIVAFEKSFIIFGGWKGDFSNIIARFDTTTRQWKKLGELNQARRDHGVIIQNGEFIVVGGRDTKKTERCSLNGDSIQCTSVDPELSSYVYYPVMMLVPENYCPK